MPKFVCDDNIRCDDDNCTPCFYDCDYIFSDVMIYPAREGGTVVQWSLGSAIRDDGPYVYSLQTGNAGVEDPKAWKTVASKPNVCFLCDRFRRLTGGYSFTHYRLKLQTVERTYYSKPINTFGTLNYADWAQYQAIIRAEHVKLQSAEGIKGQLLKRKISGLKCPKCRDFNTDEVTDGGCPICYGTGWVGGYYAPVPCFYVKCELSGSTIQHDVETRGPVVESQVTGRAIANPILTTSDIWFNEISSERYKIMQVKNAVEIRGVPTVHQLLMERLPFANIAYQFPIHH